MRKITGEMTARSPAAQWAKLDLEARWLHRDLIARRYSAIC